MKVFAVDPTSPIRRVAHLDMDAFYASVELLRRPHLKGLPIAIGGSGNPNSRGVVTTATYEARQFGVRSGISLYKANQLCKDLVMLPVDFAEYRKYSRLFKDATRAYCPIMEDRGIDEVYFELTDMPDSSEVIATELQRRVKQATGLTCSIGIAPNKLLAKICSDLNKPNGITILSADEVPSRIWPLSVKVINGIGPKAAKTLADFGVLTIGELAQVPAHLLVRKFGLSYGRWLHRAAHGLDERKLETDPEAVSISRENTLDRDLDWFKDQAEMQTELEALCMSLSHDLVRKNLWVKQIGVKVKYNDFRQVTRDMSLREPIQDIATLLQAAQRCWERIPKRRSIRLIGVKAKDLIDSSQRPAENLDLFDE